MTTLIGLICLVYLFNVAEPIEWLKKFLLVSSTTRTDKQWHMGIITLFNCSLCMGFWVGLIHYGDIYMAGIVSCSAELFHLLMKKVSRTL